MPARIAHLTLQPIENDARVARARQALTEAGYECPIVGPGHGFDLPTMTPMHKMKLAFLYGAGARLSQRAGEAAFFSLSHHRQALEAVVRMLPDAIQAHDWDGLVIAAVAAERLKIPFVYDAHEFAAEMHAERKAWRLSIAPLIAVLERSAIRRAKAVIAVSDSIGKSLEAAYGLERPPLTIRNIPDCHPIPIESIAYRGPAAPITLHYHGILARGRGIETAISALEALPPSYRLRLVGPWRQPSFESEIRQKLSDRVDDGRVVIEPALPHDGLVQHASEADIGLCLLEGATAHDQGALPNKIFEYLNAGLAIVGSGSTEIERIISLTGCGASLKECDASELVQILTAWSADDVVAMRRAAIRGAHHHSWQQEKNLLVDLWRAVVPAGP